ncbi:hypothetical protein KRX56_00795 [Dermabacteraceae bacterium TAE3-ERU27]|nr:hypothetical protein [Dermabacteraceae bacterium TAE3-ERU27]
MAYLIVNIFPVNAAFRLVKFTTFAPSALIPAIAAYYDMQNGAYTIAIVTLILLVVYTCLLYTSYKLTPRRIIGYLLFFVPLAALNLIYPGKLGDICAGLFILWLPPLVARLPLLDLCHSDKTKLWTSMVAEIKTRHYRPLPPIPFYLNADLLDQLEETKTRAKARISELDGKIASLNTEDPALESLETLSKDVRIIKEHLESREKTGIWTSIRKYIKGQHRNDA